MVRDYMLKIVAIVSLFSVVFHARARPEEMDKRIAALQADMNVQSSFSSDGLELIVDLLGLTGQSLSAISYASSKKTEEYVSVTPEFSYKKPISVALLPFTNNTGDRSLDWLANAIPESLVQGFSESSSVRVVDSSVISEILEQLGLAVSDMADSGKALKVGKLVFANIIVLGSYQKGSNNALKINARLTDVETATVVKAVEKIGSQRNIDDLINQTSHALLSTIDPDVAVPSGFIDRPSRPLGRNLVSSRISGGVKGGPNLARVSGDFEPNIHSKTGLCVGGFVTYIINDAFAVQPEVLFTTKGAKGESDSFILTDYPELGEFTYNRELNLSYLEILILAKLSMQTDGTITPSLLVGPALALNLSAKEKIEKTFSDPAVQAISESMGLDALLAEEYDYKGKDEVEGFTDLNTDLGLVFGGGIDIDLGQRKLMFEVRYTLGLKTLSTGYITFSEEIPVEVKNGVISVMVGFSF